jgi:hypothetical protein
VFPTMRSLFAALLLLFQLQPMLGTAACLGLARMQAKEGCKMPQHGSAPSHSFSAAVPVSSPGCAMATVCAPAPLAVPALANQLVRAVPLRSILPIAGTNFPTDIASAPPLPPPRV